MQMTTPIPQNMQTDFLKEVESDILPAIRQEYGKIICPVFVREFTRQIENGENSETATGYKYFEVPVDYTGQNISDYESFTMQSYAALRKYFFGPIEVQNEQILKGTFAAHQYAVKKAFPKHAGEMIENVVEYEKIKSDFWAIIDAAAELTGKTRADFPTGTSSDLLHFCVECGMTAEQTANFAIQILGITADLDRYGRNWNELFC